MIFLQIEIRPTGHKCDMPPAKLVRRLLRLALLPCWFALRCTQESPVESHAKKYAAPKSVPQDLSMNICEEKVIACLLMCIELSPHIYCLVMYIVWPPGINSNTYALQIHLDNKPNQPLTQHSPLNDFVVWTVFARSPHLSKDSYSVLHGITLHITGIK